MSNKSAATKPTNKKKNNNNMNGTKIHTSDYREELWSKVLKLRGQQLQSFTNDELTNIAKLAIEDDMTMPSLSSKHECQKYVQGLLELNFRQACKESLSETYRQDRLNDLKVMFVQIDTIYDQNNNKKKGNNIIFSESSSCVNSTSESDIHNPNKPQPQRKSNVSALPPAAAPAPAAVAIVPSARKEKNSNVSALPAPVPAVAPSVRKEPQCDPDIPKKKKVIEILTITDSDDEIEHAPQAPRYPNMSQNYNLLYKMNMRADVKKNASHSPYSSSIVERPDLQLFLSNDHTVSPAHGQEVISRFIKWEPNFIIRENLLVLKTAPPVNVSVQSTRIQTALAFKFTIPKSYISNPDIKWKQLSTTKNYTRGNKLLLLRMLPKETPKKYPDTHMWPKGTFLQLNAIPTPLTQRKQQSHNDKLWKSMCSSLDLTPHIHPTNDTSHTIELITYDDNPFYLHLAIVEYISPQDLMSSVTTNIVSYQTSLQKAKYYVNRQTVKLDDDDDDDDTQETKNSIPLTFSLSCPITLVKLSIPARGRNCDHVQCFDLLTFLSSNSFPSARRWRCVFCEKFTPVNELVVCQMFKSMLEKFNNDIEPGCKDKVELRDYDDKCSSSISSDNWTLPDQKIHKRGGVSEEQENSILNKKRKKIEEIILV